MTPAQYDLTRGARQTLGEARGRVNQPAALGTRRRRAPAEMASASGGPPHEREFAGRGTRVPVLEGAAYPGRVNRGG